MPQQTPEYIHVELPIVQQLTSMGWQYIEGDWDNAEVTERENFKQVLLTERLKAAIKRINLDDNGNPWLDDLQMQAAVSQLERLGANRLMEANQAATESACFDIRAELPKLREKHQQVMALFTKNGCTIDDVDACVDLLRDERLRVEFNDCFKDFLNTLDTILPRSEARQPYNFVRDAKKLGFIKKAVAHLYRDEKLNIVSAKEKVRALIDQYIGSQGIDPKVPPIDIMSLDFKTHVQRHRSIKAQAAEMEFAARHHISVNYEEDPVYYKNLSEKLT